MRSLVFTRKCYKKIIPATLCATSLLFATHAMANTVTVPFNKTFSYSKKTVDAGQSETWRAGVAQLECTNAINERAREFGGKVKSSEGKAMNVRTKVEKGPWYDRWTETYVYMDIVCKGKLEISSL